MVKRLLTLCGNHPELPESEWPEGRERTYGLNGKWWTIDLCDPCDKVVLQPLRDLKDISERIPDGQKPVTNPGGKGRPSLTEPDNFCVFCKDGPPRSESGVTMHAYKTHGFPNQKIMSIYGDTCPLDNEKFEQTVSFTNHAIHAHGCANVAQLFARGRDAGDPHGVVAGRFKVAKKVTATIKGGQGK